MSLIRIHNQKAVLDSIDEFHADAQRAAKNAVKVEAFRLKNLLQKDLRTGSGVAAGFDPLREVSKRYSRKPSQRGKAPLSPLAKAVRYYVADNGMPYRLELGFVGASISHKWKEIAMRQQAGATYPVHPAVKERLKQIGIALKKKKDPSAKFFFLKTTSFVDPRRDIIDTFREAHQAEMFANIKSNFERKMRGERI
ncbi:MAG: hypothetical protein A4E65_02310 [Syntrophorhabdus sp. PtaU1.Bin153]|nr:MAG: hypothetical protein A4E65_02310 [Syntrophorhabdus sp. PtaU1.Bin153]